MTNSDENGSAEPPVTDPGDGPNDKPDTGQPPDGPKEFRFQIDRQDVKVSADELTDGGLTGADIRRLTDPPIGPDRDLFEIVPGGPDRKIEATDRVRIRNRMRFFSAPATINPGAPPREAARRSCRTRRPDRGESNASH